MDVTPIGFIPGEPFVLLPKNIKAIPRGFLRSALFSHSLARRSFFRTEFYTNGDLSIIFTGFHLTQFDLDVWSSIMKISMEFDGQCGVVFYPELTINASDLLRSIGRGTSGSELKLLVASLTRLQAAVIEISDGGYSYSGQLINSVKRNPDLTYKIIINLDIAKLFGKSGWTGVDIENRRKLSRRPLAQWLHGFYSSHENTSMYFYSLRKIRDISGSGDINPSGFKRNVKNALAAVEDATGWKCWIDERDCLHVQKHTT